MRSVWPGDDLYERRNFFGALVARLEAARAEDAATGRIDRAGDVAAQHDARAVALLLRVRDGHGRQQRVRVRVQRRRVQTWRGADSMILPRYMTDTRCEIWRTTARSWATNR